MTNNFFYESLYYFIFYIMKTHLDRDIKIVNNVIKLASSFDN